jgi:hypothetical protein
MYVTLDRQNLHMFHVEHAMLNILLIKYATTQQLKQCKSV